MITGFRDERWSVILNIFLERLTLAEGKLSQYIRHQGPDSNTKPTEYEASVLPSLL
jgi:hypothetical protein